MARRRRGFKAPKVSFIMFQDIMTAVTGILILIVILQIIQVNDAPSKTTESKAATAEQRAELKKLQEQLQTAEEVDATLRGKLRESVEQQLSDVSPISSAEMEGEIVRDKGHLQQLESDLTKEKRDEQERDSTVGLAQDEQNLTASEQQAKVSQNKIVNLLGEEKDKQSEIHELEIKLHNAEERQKRLYLIPDEAQTSKEPVVAVVSKTGIEFSRFNHPTESKQVLNVDDEDAVGKAIDSYSSGEQYFVFYIKPSGVGAFEKLYNIAQAKGFDVGFDAIEENQQIVVAQPPGSDADEATPVAVAHSSNGSVTNAAPQGGSPSAGASTTNSPVSVMRPTAPNQPVATASQGPPATSSSNTATNVPTSSADSNVQSTNADQQVHTPSSAGVTPSATAQPQAASSPLPWILIAVALLIAVVLAYFFIRNR